MTTKRDLTARNGEPDERSSARRNQLAEARGDDGPRPVNAREKRDKTSREDDPEAGIHDA
jgi:hypothetical protein